MSTMYHPDSPSHTESKTLPDHLSSREIKSLLRLKCIKNAQQDPWVSQCAVECIGVVVFVAPVRTGHRPQYVTDGNLPANYAFSTVLEKIGERYKPW